MDKIILFVAEVALLVAEMTFKVVVMASLVVSQDHFCSDRHHSLGADIRLLVAKVNL